MFGQDQIVRGVNRSISMFPINRYQLTKIQKIKKVIPNYLLYLPSKILFPSLMKKMTIIQIDIIHQNSMNKIRLLTKVNLTRLKLCLRNQVMTRTPRKMLKNKRRYNSRHNKLLMMLCQKLYHKKKNKSLIKLLPLLRAKLMKMKTKTAGLFRVTM